MKKSEMEDHHDAYLALESKIDRMTQNREFPAVFVACVESFPHIVPAIKFRKQAGIAPETPPLMAIAVLCKYAPPLFAHAFLEQLLDFVKSTRQLARHENGYLQSAEAALDREEVARMLWNHLERQPGALQQDISELLAIDHAAAIEIADTWERLGIIVRYKEANSYRLHLRTQADAEVEGLCPACGVRGKGRRDLFLEPIVCQRCNAEGHYYIQYGPLQ